MEKVSSNLFWLHKRSSSQKRWYSRALHSDDFGDKKNQCSELLHSTLGKGGKGLMPTINKPDFIFTSTLKIEPHQNLHFMLYFHIICCKILRPGLLKAKIKDQM